MSCSLHGGGSSHPFRPSVVIPTFQRADLIARAVMSALSQELEPEEIIVVDDGSTDGTADVLHSLRGPIRYHRQPNQGVAAARNAGVRLAVSEWVAFLDSDDVWLPGHLRRVEEAVAATDARATLYFADATVTVAGEQRSWFELCGFTPMRPHEETTRAIDWVMLPFQPMLLPASVVRRQAWIELGGLREDLPTREDTHLFLRLGVEGGACAISDIGLEVTSDSQPGSRLTERHRAGAKVYADASVKLYQDVLTTTDPRRLTASAVRVLRGRLADAYWQLGSTQLGEGRWARGARSLLTSFRVDPGAASARVARRLRGATRRRGSVG